MNLNEPVRARFHALACLVAGLVFTTPVAAQPDEEIVVIGVTPAQGTVLPPGKIPYSVQTASAEDIERSQSLDLTDFLNRNVGSISLNMAQNNPLQPDVQYRGFTASPLLGLPQGIAVYQNGIRINEPLGDAVNWDLLPESAIYQINHIGGANPVFGLNTLGGALSVLMKNGFNAEGHHLKAWGGSFERKVVTAESGGNNGEWGYYANVHYFDEEGWRDLSPSDALNFYGSLGWRGTVSELNLNLQHGDTELRGNGPAPVELLDLDREAVFTAPDITENDMTMVSADLTHDFSDDIRMAANGFYRRQETASFNGDASEFAVCELGGTERLLEGLEDDDLEELGLDDDDICASQFADADALEDFLNAAAADDEFNLEDLTGEVSGTGILADQAINNTSDRAQDTWGADLQFTFFQDLFGRGNQFVLGAAWFKGVTDFNSVIELAALDPITRSTEGLGTGAFVDGGATSIETRNESYSLYFMNTLDVTENVALTLAGRFNSTEINLEDQSGERPELNGNHNFDRFNPAVGVTWQLNEQVNVYGGYSESSRAPTPIELSCNEHIFEIAAANALADGEDPEDVEFECRLPNAFLADPPLHQVVTKSFEAGVRGSFGTTKYHLGFFHTENNDDIIFQTTGRATGLFANVDQTRRLGIEANLHGTWRKLDWFAAYSYLEATFEDDFQVLSPNHPFADEDEGTIAVTPGDRIPGIPAHNLKIGSDYYFTEAFSAGLEMIYHSGQYLRGDESNQLEKVDGYAVVNLRGRYRFSDNVEVFARVNNLLDNDYESFGILGEEPGEVQVPIIEDFTIPRFLGPGAPIAGFAGVKVSF